MFALVNFIISMLIVGVDNALGFFFNYSGNVSEAGVFNLLYNLLILIPSLAVAVRRLDAINRFNTPSWSNLAINIVVKR